MLLAVLKIIATAVCYASGNAGGIFGPSMFIGAMIGARRRCMSRISLFPAVTAGPGAYALVGMGTAFAGIIRTPLTSVIMIFEVTRNYTIIVPLMISNLIAFYISQQLQREPIYEALARQDGLHLPHGGSQHEPGGLQVYAALKPPPPTLAAALPVGQVLERAGPAPLSAWPVVNERGLMGMLRASEIAAAVADGRSATTVGELLASLRARPDSVEGVEDFAHIHPDQPLGQALVRMGETRQTVLPVVSRANARELIGIVTLEDVLKTYGVSRPEELSPADLATGG